MAPKAKSKVVAGSSKSQAADKVTSGIPEKGSKAKSAKGKKAIVQEQGEEEGDAEQGGKKNNSCGNEVPGDEEQEGDVVEGEDLDQGVTAERHPLDTFCNQAIITICRVNILNPPVPIVWGIWNPRPISEEHVLKLLNQMSKNRIRPFANNNLLPIVIKPSAIDPSCIYKEPNAEAAPVLKLTEEAVNSGIKLMFAGGHHRKEATLRIQEKSQEAINDIARQIDEMKQEKKAAEEGSRPTGALNTKIGKMEKRLQREQRVHDTIGIWGVILYDEEPMLLNAAAGATHLSSNEYVHHYYEGPSERMEKYMAQYRSNCDGKAAWEVEKWINTIAAQNSKVGQIFHHTETVNYLRQLSQFRPHFMLDSIYSEKFCIDKLHNVNGGMLGLTVQYGLSILTGLFRDQDCEMGGSSEFKAYVKDLANLKIDDVKDTWEDKIVRTWNTLLQPANSTLPHQQVMELLDEMDRIFVQIFKGKESLFLTQTDTWDHLWPEYMQNIKDLAKRITQSATADPLVTAVLQHLAGKVRFVTQDHRELHMAPPMPLMTKSVVEMMAQALSEIELALREVGFQFILWDMPKSKTFDFVGSYWSWFDWLPPYMMSKPNHKLAKDISAWVIRTILQNPAKDWEYPNEAVNTLIFFVWRHMDAFISMQQYLETHQHPRRPQFLDVSRKKVLEQYKAAFDDNENAPTLKIMKELKNTKQASAHVGTLVWPLDFHSCLDWRETGRNSRQTLSEYIHMANIELNIISQYRSTLLTECQAAAYIRYKVSSELALYSKKKPRNIINPKSQKMESKLESLFIYHDKVPNSVTANAEPPAFDTEATKAKRGNAARTRKQLADTEAVLKKLESLAAVSAAPGNTDMHPSIFKLINELKSTISENVARLARMEDALQDDEAAVMNPYLQQYQPNKCECHPMSYSRRHVYKVPIDAEAAKEKSAPVSDNDDDKVVTRATSGQTVQGDPTKSNSIDVEGQPISNLVSENIVSAPDPLTSTPLDDGTFDISSAMAPMTLDVITVVPDPSKSTRFDFKGSPAQEHAEPSLDPIQQDVDPKSDDGDQSAPDISADQLDGGMDLDDVPTFADPASQESDSSQSGLSGNHESFAAGSSQAYHSKNPATKRARTTPHQSPSHERKKTRLAKDRALSADSASQTQVERQQVPFRPRAARK
ncbi:hypothetical protein M378DRAFT_9652 [Amanita muscaria Koide BX008]|uniref:Uncharacterized protein n=1 Tax=Amanita muscaria (strain Koide BX008) TaxID=946122 RepID=A0A0C2XDM1_AMAMK|nr:hypothetical protein M378DRAFT_9652 [Amanita muscaria Koide BX008]